MTRRAHARLSPSDSQRWMSCAGSINLTERLKEERSSRFAAEGTAAHQVREECLTLGLDTYDLIGHSLLVDGFVFKVDDEMADALQPGIDRVREFEGRMVVEHNVYLDRWMPGQFGTLDVGIVGSDLIVINDLKYGAGIPVSPVENTQLQIYALGFWDQIARHETDAKDFLIIVDQPRINAGGGEWRISLDDLLAFGETVEQAARATEDPDAPRTPSAKACQWCPASKVDGMCPEFEAWNLSMVGLEFEDLDDPSAELVLPDIQGITPARRSVIVQNWHTFLKWGERLHADVLADALSGRPTPGLKAVEGRHGNRKWTEESAAERFLAKRLSLEDIFTKKLISPAQAEKKLGKGNLPKALVERGAPKPILAPEKDERPAIRSAAEFDNLDT